MKTNRKKRLYLILFILIGVACATSLILYAARNNLNHFYEIVEIKSGDAPINRQIRMGGMVKADSIKRTENSLKVSFIVTDFKSDVLVEYTGVLPDLFREGQGVMATGKLINTNHFIADQILAKHDENYMPPEIKEQHEAINKNTANISEQK